MSDPCDRYIGFGTQWPTSPFPASYFPRMDTKQVNANTRAWNFFEQVESYDANVRVTTSTVQVAGHTTDRSIWYPIDTQSKLLLYQQGQALHRFLCPMYSWKPQRDYGISSPPPTNVYPLATCNPPAGEPVGTGPC
jgi:hypothetical protein